MNAYKKIMETLDKINEEYDDEYDAQDEYNDKIYYGEIDPDDDCETCDEEWDDGSRGLSPSERNR